MQAINQTAISIASEILSIDSRERKRSAEAQKRFEYAILLKDLRLGTAIHTEYENGIHRGSNWYWETPQLVVFIRLLNSSTDKLGSLREGNDELDVEIFYACFYGDIAQKHCRLWQ